MKITLRIIGLLGMLLFGTAFWFTYDAPGFVEDAAKDFIRAQIEEETKEKIDSITLNVKDSKLGQAANKLLKSKEEEIARLISQLKTQVHEQIDGVIAEMSDPDCECRKKYAQLIKEIIELRITSLQNAKTALSEFMKTKYMEVSLNLSLDLRIFAGSNFFVFSLLLIVSFLKPEAITHLFLPGVLLFVSTLACSYFYLFEQNWFFSIIYNDYVGFAYLAYIAMLFGLLCDIVFNRGRIITQIINAFLNAIGSALTVAPC